MARRKVRMRPTREETRDRVLDGAAAAFSERGFHGASIDEICARAGLTSGAFHSSFTSKEDLFLALYDRMIERVRARLEAALEAASSTSGSIEAAVRQYAADAAADREWFLLSSEFNLYAIRQPSVAPMLAEHRCALLQAMRDGLQKYLDRNGLKLNVDGIEYARLLMALNEGGLGQSLIEPDTVRPGDLLARFAPAMLNAFVVSDDA